MLIGVIMCLARNDFTYSDVIYDYNFLSFSTVSCKESTNSRYG